MNLPPGMPISTTPAHSPELAAVNGAIADLERDGPALGRPLVDRIHGSVVSQHEGTAAVG